MTYQFKNTAPTIESVQQGMRLAKTAFFTRMSDVYTFGKEVQWGYPIGFNGLPGNGKTSIWMQLASQLQFNDNPVPAEIFDPGAMGEASNGVTPVPVQTVYVHPDGREETITALSFPPPLKYVQMFQGKPGLFVIDDLTNIRGATQDSLFGLLTTKKMGDFQFNGGVRMGAAMNPTEITPGGEHIAPAVWNRFGLFNWHGPTAKETAVYFEGGANYQALDLEPIDVKAEEKRIGALIDKAYPAIVGAWAAWVSARPDMLHSMPSIGKMDAEGPWASHRSHEGAIRFCATAMAYGLDETEQQMCLQAGIGREAANDFFIFRKELDLPDPTDFLDGRIHFEHNVQRLDRTVAVLSSCRTVISGMNKSKLKNTRALNFVKFLNSVAENAQDLVVQTTGHIFKEFRGERAVVASDEYTDLIEKVGSVVNVGAARL